MDEYIWKIAKSEKSTIRKNLSRELKCQEGVPPSFQRITSLFFGPHSKFMQIFLTKLEINYETFMLFMATFCLAKALSLDLACLYKGRIKIDGLLEKESYTNLWKKIASKQDNRDCYAIPFWKELEDAMIGFTWERVGDISTSSCYKQIIQNQFGDMTGLLWASNHGYWNSNLVFEYLLKSNADIHGTVKRCPWFPFISKFWKRMILRCLCLLKGCTHF